MCLTLACAMKHTLTTGIVSGLDRTVQSAAGSLISGGIQTVRVSLFTPCAQHEPHSPLVPVDFIGCGYQSW